MMAHPADDAYAHSCLKLWGLGQSYGGPEGYKSHSAFVLRARGIPVEWNSDLDDVVGSVVLHCLDAEQRAIVRMYYQPQSDSRCNGEYLQCNMTLTLNKLSENNAKADRNKVNRALDRVIGKVAMALSYPPAVWLEMQKQYSEMDELKKVSNF